MSQSNFLNDHPPFEAEPALRCCHFILSRSFATYRRTQVGGADVLHPVRFQRARNDFGGHTLSSFPPVDDYEIMSEIDQFSDYISLADLMTPRCPIEQQFISAERSPHLFLENLDIHDTFPCDVCYEISSSTIPIDPIHREINPISIGNRLCSDLRGSRLSHPLTHQQADPPVSPYVMRTERDLHRSFGPRARPGCSYNRASCERVAGLGEGPYRVQIAGLPPQMMNPDAHGFLEHEGPPLASSIVNNNSGDGSIYSSGESATAMQNFLDITENPSSPEQTVGSASNPPNNIEDNAVGVAANPDPGNDDTTVDKEAVEDNAGPSGKLPFTWF